MLWQKIFDNESTSWPINTILLAGDSIINGIDEKRLSEKNSNVKVRYFNGALEEDIFYNLVPLTRKKRSALILHVDLARESLNMIHKTLSTLVWRPHGSPLSIPVKGNLQQTSSCFEEKNTRIPKFKRRSRFFLTWLW